MPIVSNKSGSSLDSIEIADIESRVSRVTSLLNNSAFLWLEIAKEFVDAKIKLSQLGFERFINDAGFTKAVADKLISVGKCNRLYQQDASPFIGFVDGWSTLYEVSKLEDRQIDALWLELKKTPNLRLSRSVVRNVAEGNAANDKLVVFVTVGVKESQIKNLTFRQVCDFKEKLEELRELFDESPTTIVVKERESAVKMLTISDAVKSNGDFLIAQTAA